MNIIIQGIKLDKGDEILRTNLEYPNIIQALDMRERRFGTKVRIVDVPIHPTSQQEIVDKVIGAVNKKTKVILISLIVFLYGEVFGVFVFFGMGCEMGVVSFVGVSYCVVWIVSNS